MKFGPVPLAEAEGAVLAHSVTAGGRKLRKGITLQPDQIALLAGAGIDSVIVARLELGDCPENEAAGRLARAVVPVPEASGLRLTAPFAGRVNVLADAPGVVVLDAGALEAFNRIDPMITIATVPNHQQMATGGMVATIKIISYAVRALDVEAAAEAGRGSLRLARPVLSSAGLVVTQIPGGPKDDKGITAISQRLEALNMGLDEVRFVPHRMDALSAALSEIGGDMILILTGSATSDPNDVAPSALRDSGGQVGRFGMPVDPGNLLFLGNLGARPVIGLPGCVRSPALNGADWVLSRVACGLRVSASDIAAMGVGGLLKEIPTRPQPRAGRR